MADTLSKLYRSLNSSSNSIPTATFTPAGFESAGFTPSEYKPQSPDLRYYANLINEKNTSYDKVAENIGMIESAINSLPMDDSERAYIQDYANNVRQNIQKFIDANDYRGAMRESERLAKSAATDSRLATRHYRFKAYETERERIANAKDIDELTKQRWLSQNTYDTNKIENADGTVNQWRASWNPIRNVRLDDVVSKAAQHVAERSKQSSWDISQRGVNPNTSGSGRGAYGVTTEQGGGSSIHYKTEKQIRDVFDELMDLYPEEMSWLQQDYENQVWLKNQLETKQNSGEELSPVEKSQLDVANRRLNKGAGIKSASEYLWELMGNTVKAESYTRTSNASKQGTDYTELNTRQALGEATEQTLLDMSTQGEDVNIYYMNYNNSGIGDNASSVIGTKNKQ